MKNFLFWVAVSVLAGILLLNVEYSIFQSEEQLTRAVGPTSKSQYEYDVPESIPEKTKVQNVNPAQGIEAVSLKEALQLALKIHSPSNRDTALQELVSVALEVNELLIAIEITDSILSPSTRNKTYTRIVEQALLMSDFQPAEIAAKKIISPSMRDSQLQKILRESVENE